MTKMGKRRNVGSILNKNVPTVKARDYPVFIIFKIAKSLELYSAHTFGFC